jgi:hypothetical protein
MLKFVSSMKKPILKYKLEILGVLMGSVAGWLYWYYVGCTSGTCVITSSPVNSSLYGALLGALLFGLLKKENKREDQKTQSEAEQTHFVTKRNKK